MAPTKSTRSVVAASKQMEPSLTTAGAILNPLVPLARKGLARRTAQNNLDQNVVSDMMQTRGKRKAEHSPMHGKNEKIKRSALGNLTNNVKAMTMTTKTEEHQQQSLKKKEIKIYAHAQLLKDAAAARQNNKITTRASTRNAINNQQLQQTKSNLDEQTNNLLANVATAAAASAVKSKHDDASLLLPPPAAPIAPAVVHNKVLPTHKPMRRISNEFNKSEEENSLYMSALEDISSCESTRLSGNFEAAKRRSILLQQQQQEKLKTEDTGEAGSKTSEEAVTSEPDTKHSQKYAVLVPSLPCGVEDFDKTGCNDPFQVSNYAMEIFQYLKEREAEFVISDYMQRQIHLSRGMRSLLVDWMVEVQETFELNHETLYLAVKIVDLYLCRVVISKDKLQLLGAAALFIACKFDERTPPLIEDFLYICDGAYKHDELIQMEMNTLRIINYDLGIPLSYRFLRRYARCAKVPMPTLTLARYILELSLMDYSTVSLSDSQIAAAALFMALRMHGEMKKWTPTLEHYTGYTVTEFADIIPILNAGLHRKSKGTIKTIRSKYSHKIFHEVAKVALMTTEQLFEHNLDLNIGVSTVKEMMTAANAAKVSAAADIVTSA